MSLPRICIFTETYYPVIGGGETQARLLAERLSACGYSVIILTRRSDPSLKQVEQFGPVTVYRLSPTGSGQRKKWGLLLSSLPVLIRLRNQYDLIFVSGFRIIGLAAVLVSRLFNKRCVLKSDSQGEMSGDFFINGLQKQNLSPSFAPFRFFLGFRNTVLRRADAFIAISPEIAAEYLSAGIHPDQIHQIPNSVDTARFYPVPAEEKKDLRTKLGLPQDAKIVTYTGRLVSYKGLPLLLEVWRELSARYHHIYLLVVGAGGLDIHNCETQLQAFVNENGLSESVRFTGSVENVQEYLQASDIFAFPTKDDALPSSLIEAMACALPVITTPIGAIKTIVTDHQNGLVIPPGDTQALKERLELLFNDDLLAASLGKAAWKTMQNLYSAEVVTAQYISLFHQIAARSRQIASLSQ